MGGTDPAESYPRAFRDKVSGILREMGVETEPIIERPRSGQADLCLVCFPLSGPLGRSPEEIAREIGGRVGSNDLWTLEAAGGYLNCFFRTDRYVMEVASYIWSNIESYGQGSMSGRRTVVEHTSANPNGPFHVGRARNPIIGDTLVRLLRLSGSEVEAQYWVNDMGKQVMILVWGMANIGEEELPGSDMEKADHRLVRFYQAANARMESDPVVKESIDGMLGRYEKAVEDGDWDRRLSLEDEPDIRARNVRETCMEVLEGMKESLSRLNVEFDSFDYESRVVEDGSLREVVKGLERSRLDRTEDGAHYLDLSTIIPGGDDDRFKRRFVFTRSDGSSLYTTRDLAYHRWKLERWDRAVNVLGEDHRFQSHMLSLALREIGVKEEPEVVFYAFVSLPEGKMSTRRGRVVFIDDLLDEAVGRAREEVLKRRDDVGEDELEEISRSIGIGALRFNIIKVQSEKKIVFRWEEALNFEGSSAPFVQYAHARASSILRKAGAPSLDGEMDWTALVEGSERSLVKRFSGFKETVEKCVREMKPHIMAAYLIELASSFNEFYRDCPVLNEPNGSRRLVRLALVDMSRRILARGLRALGIDAPERM